jgi:zinc transporter ZupT
LFFWLAASEGENLPAGLAQAAEFYYARAMSRAEILLYAALPACVLVLGMVVLSQYFWLFKLIFGLVALSDSIGDAGP